VWWFPGVVAGLAIGLAVIWLILLIGLAIFRPDSATLTDAARILPDTIRLVHRLARDKTLGRNVRIRLFLLLGYLALPIDLIPDFIPVVGYADDVIVTGIVLRSVIRRAGAEKVRGQWPGSDEAFAVLARLCRLTGST
jgi:uncharacterized membrane protein YkvA (DUF1232 family)